MGNDQSAPSQPNENHASDTETPASSLVPIVPEPSDIQLSIPRYTVFISHAGEDKATIALPLREKLSALGITAFVDETDIPVGTDAKQVMIHAMETAAVAIVVLSPEFVARKWPMKELMHFLYRRERCGPAHTAPVIIPVFYRLNVTQLYDEPRLDRKDKNGDSLYKKSRFYERQENREPEANIAAIKAALQAVHGIMGVRNDMDASNDSSHLMHYRRELLLQQICNKMTQVVRARSVQMTANGTPGRPLSHLGDFCAHFETPLDTSELLFDFDSKDGSGYPSTQEGKLLQQLLDTSKPLIRAIALRGMSGVGKTSLLRGISGLQAIKERFVDGVYYLSLGMDATRSELIEALSKAVQNSGGEEKADAMRIQSDFREVTKLFRSWFAKKQCLFLVDDVLQTKEITSGTIYELLKLHVSGQGSKVLLTTRSMEVAAEADAHFSLEPRGPLNAESRAILVQYSGIEPDPGQDDIKKAMDQILGRCGGLPLLLAVAGKAVKALRFRVRQNECLAYSVYAKRLEASTQALLTTDIGWYKGLSDRLMISINLLEDRKRDFEFQVSITLAEMHRRLSVAPKQTRVPMGMLRWLWELKTENQAAIVAREFEQVGLAHVDFDITGSEPVELLRLHDSVYEFAAIETQKHREEKVGHEALLIGYGRRLALKGAYREWWRSYLESDGYIHQNLCRHLRAARRGSELVWLLLTPHWVGRQLDVNGIPFVEADFAVGIKALQDGMTDDSEADRSDKEEALRLISEAAALSSAFIAKHNAEFWFQLHGRLRGHSARYRAIRDYVGSIELNGPRPLALSINSVLKEPGGSNTTIVPVGSPVNCMAVFNDLERIACGCRNGKVVVVNVLRREIQKEWHAHDMSVKTIAVGGNGTRVLSGSADRTAKVWDFETGHRVATFASHTGVVKYVGLSADERHAVSCSADGTVQLWDTETGQLESQLFKGRKGSVECATVSTDGEHVVTGGRDGKVRLWSIRSGAQVDVAFDCHTRWVQCVAITSDGRRIVSGSVDGVLKVWDAASHEHIGAALVGPSRAVECLAVSADGNRIVSGSRDRKVRLWDRQSAKEVCDPLIGHTMYITGVSFLTGDSIVSCSVDGTVRVWNTRRKNPARVADRYGFNVSSISFLPNGKHVLLGSGDTTLRVMDAESALQSGIPMQGHSRYVSGIAVTGDGRRAVSVSHDRTVGVWDVASRKLLHRLSGHTEWIWCVAVTPTGDRAVTGSSDKTVRIWNLVAADGSHDVLEGHKAPLKSVFITDDGLRIVSVDEKSNIFVWMLDTRTLINQFSKDDAWKLSRREVLSVVGETTVQDDTKLSIPKYGRDVVYGDGPDKQVLATMEADILTWALSPDMKSVSIGLRDGKVAFLKLER